MLTIQILEAEDHDQGYEIEKREAQGDQKMERPMRLRREMR